MPGFSVNLSLIFTERALLSRFSAARAQGFDAVEIQFPYAVSPQDLKQALADEGLELVLFNVAAGDLMAGGEGLASVPERKGDFARALEQAVTYAEVLKPHCINVLPGRCLDTGRRAAYLDTLLDNLAVAADAFSPLGIRTVFEAINTLDMPSFLVTPGNPMLAVLERLGRADVFMQVDIYHFARMGEDAAAFIEAHGGRIGHIQFADVPGRGQPGSGAIDFAALFARIEASPYQGWLGAEYKPVGPSEESFGWFR